MTGLRIRLPALLTALCLLLPTAGCGFKDIDKRFFVVTVGLDAPTKEGMLYKVSLRLAIPSGQESFGTNRSILVQQEAKSVTEAVRFIKSKVDKELDFGHTKAILIGDKLLQGNTDIQKMFDWFLRRRDIQKIAWVAVAKPSALDVMSMEPKSERLPSNQLFLFFGGTGTETAYVVSEYLFDLGRRLSERGLDPILPIVEVRDEKSGQLMVNKVAIFNKERKVAELNPEETKIFNTLYNSPGKADLSLMDGDKRVVFAMDRMGSSFSARRDSDGSVKLKVRVHMSGIVEENGDEDKKNLQVLSGLVEKTVRTRATALLKKIQKTGADPIGFGLDYRAKHKAGAAVWEQWTEEYAQAELEVEAKVKIKGTGILE